MSKIEGNFKIKHDDYKAKILSSSFIWIALGIAIVSLVGFLILEISLLNKIFSNFFYLNNFMWLFMSIGFMIATYLINSIAQKNINFLYKIIFFILYSFFASIVVVGLFLNVSYNHNISYFLLILLIPTVLMMIMGILGYFNILNFSLFMPFTIMASIIVSLFSIGAFLFQLFFPIFVNFGFVLIPIVMVIILTISIGFQIQQFSKNLNSFNEFSWELSFSFGVSLFSSFIYLLIYILRLINIFRR